MLNLFHNEGFVFDNGYEFPERQGSQKAFSGEGDFVPVRPGRNMWETNFIPDLSAFELKEWKARGAGGSSMMFVLAEGTMHAHSSQMPVGTYKKGHRHGRGFPCLRRHRSRLFAALVRHRQGSGAGRLAARRGVCATGPDVPSALQHVCAILRAIWRWRFGGLRYPFTQAKRHVFTGMDVNVQDGGCQIEYEDQDPRIHRIYLEELAKHGVRSDMGKFIDETARRPQSGLNVGAAMHDLEFEHLHVAAPQEINEAAWTADNVELTTVGIDIGSSTSHLMFSRVHLQRLGTALSSRFVVVERKVVWQSPILLTPYLPDFTIDIDELEGFIAGCYGYADVDPDDVDSGAVILTGEAIKRHNARAIADLFSEEAGRFVCASAGHHMECQLRPTARAQSRCHARAP